MKCKPRLQYEGWYVLQTAALMQEWKRQRLLSFLEHVLLDNAVDLWVHYI